MMLEPVVGSTKKGIDAHCSVSGLTKKHIEKMENEWKMEDIGTNILNKSSMVDKIGTESGFAYCPAAQTNSWQTKK